MAKEVLGALGSVRRRIVGGTRTYQGLGVFKIKEGMIGIKGDHKVWKVWRDEFMANLP